LPIRPDRITALPSAIFSFISLPLLISSYFPFPSPDLFSTREVLRKVRLHHWLRILFPVPLWISVTVNRTVSRWGSSFPHHAFFFPFSFILSFVVALYEKMMPAAASLPT